MYENTCGWRGFQTWFRVTGDLNSGKVPLIVAHGGPGCTHDYVARYADLAEGGRPVIHYDQIGNGRSTHLRDAPTNFWCVELFLEELATLVAHLGIEGRYNLLGQSWGGMLAAEHGVLEPVGLNALVIANSPSGMPIWISETKRLRIALPEAVQAALAQHEATGDYDHPEYKAAVEVFYRRHVCRLDIWPDEVERTFAAIEDDPTVYHTMNGPTEFHVIGSMKEWDIADRLSRISVPTLVLSGEWDEATPRTVEAYAIEIPGAEWVILKGTSHMPHVEDPDACMSAVEKFLVRHD
jgi:L-proline amide hydrolase